MYVVIIIIIMVVIRRRDENSNFYSLLLFIVGRMYYCKLDAGKNFSKEIFLIVIDVKYENMNRDNNIIIGLRTHVVLYFAQNIIIRTTRTAAA